MSIAGRMKRISEEIDTVMNDQPKQQMTEKSTEALAGFFHVAGEENIAPDVIMAALLASGIAFAIRLGLTDTQIAEMMATMVLGVRASVPADDAAAAEISGGIPPLEMP